MKVTDFREVEYIVPDGTALPDEITKTLEFYEGRRAKNSHSGQWGTKYQIPVYLMQEWLAKYGRPRLARALLAQEVK